MKVVGMMLIGSSECLIHFWFISQPWIFCTFVRLCEKGWLTSMTANNEASKWHRSACCLPEGPKALCVGPAHLQSSMRLPVLLSPDRGTTHSFNRLKLFYRNQVIMCREIKRSLQKSVKNTPVCNLLCMHFTFWLMHILRIQLCCGYIFTKKKLKLKTDINREVLISSFEMRKCVTRINAVTHDMKQNGKSAKS